MTRAERVVPVWAVATVLAAAVLVLTGADLRQHYDLDPGLTSAFSLGWAVLVAAAVLVGRRPVAGVVVVVLAAVLAVVTAIGTYPVTRTEPWPWSVGATATVLVVLVAVGCRVGRGRRPLLAAAWLLVQAAGVMGVLSGDGLGTWSGLLPMAVLSAVAVVVAELVAAGRADRRERDTSRHEADVAVAARRAADERRELAHELHDVVAHHLSVVVVRADSAPARLTGLDAATRAEFTAVADDARICLEQMRRVLQVLDTGSTAPPVEPQPGIADLPALVAGARSAGATVELAVDVPDGFTPDPLPGLTAYRVAQEALTNALRHAPGAPVRIAVRADAHVLTVAVTHPAGAAGPARPAGEGRGLHGMRERVAVVAGVLEAGPTADGGFRVRAALPLRVPTAVEVAR